MPLKNALFWWGMDALVTVCPSAKNVILFGHGCACPWNMNVVSYDLGMDALVTSCPSNMNVVALVTVRAWSTKLS